MGLLARFSLSYFLDVFKITFALFIAVNDINNTNSQNSRNVIRSSRKISHFQGVSSSLQQSFQIQALVNEFKDLHEPCT